MYGTPGEGSAKTGMGLGLCWGEWTGWTGTNYRDLSRGYSGSFGDRWSVAVMMEGRSVSEVQFGGGADTTR